MISKLKKLLPLLLVLALAAYLRLNHISSNPPSLFSDEVDASYQAFVFNHRGTDYYGNSLPSHFHSFSDWRTPLYIYSIAFAQKIVGINALSTRLPATIFGLVSIYIFYLILKKLFKPKTALIGAALLAITPWHIHYSRIGFEVTGMLLSYLLSIYYLINFTRTKRVKHLAIFLIGQILATYFYSTAKLFSLFTISLAFIFWQKEIKQVKTTKLIIVGLLTLLIAFPMIKDTLIGHSGHRFSYINIFTDPTVPQQIDYLRRQKAIQDFGPGLNLPTTTISKFLYNKPLFWFQRLTNNYLSSFSTDFLFLNGDRNLRHGFGQYGYFYFIDFFFIILGLSIALFNKNKSRTNKNRYHRFFLYLLILSPLPFSLTRDSISPHATRLILTLLLLSYFAILGLDSIINKKTKLLIILIPIYLFACFNFNHFYHYQYPHLSAGQWHSNIKTAVQQSYELKADKYFYSDSYQPILPFFLFWTKYLPNQTNIASTIKHHDTPSLTGQLIDQKYFFGHIEWGQIKNKIDSSLDNIFIAPKSELATIQQALGQIDVIKKIDSNFDTGQAFIVFKIN